MESKLESGIKFLVFRLQCLGSNYDRMKIFCILQFLLSFCGTGLLELTSWYSYFSPLKMIFILKKLSQCHLSVNNLSLVWNFIMLRGLSFISISLKWTITHRNSSLQKQNKILILHRKFVTKFFSNHAVNWKQCLRRHFLSMAILYPLFLECFEQFAFHHLIQIVSDAYNFLCAS